MVSHRSCDHDITQADWSSGRYRPIPIPIPIPIPYRRYRYRYLISFWRADRPAAVMWLASGQLIRHPWLSCDWPSGRHVTFYSKWPLIGQPAVTWSTSDNLIGHSDVSRDSFIKLADWPSPPGGRPAARGPRSGPRCWGRHRRPAWWERRAGPSLSGRRGKPYCPAPLLCTA